MKNRFFVSLIIIALAGGLVYTRKHNQKVEKIQNIEEVVEIEKQSRYQPYSDKLLENSSAQTKVLFFKTSESISSKKLHDDIKLNQKEIPESWLILEIDYNSNTKLVEKYNVKSEHSLVLLNQKSEPIETWSAIMSLEDLKSISPK
jgi:hypothetical protein